MRDNQPKHRQLAKARRKGERKINTRQELPTALVVCEGKRTEPAYLRGLLRHMSVSSANATIDDGRSDADAVSVVERARVQFERTPEYDRIFAVIDAEQKNLADALALCRKPVQRANQKKGLSEIRIEPIVTTPCFEFWLLLHFAYTDQPNLDCAGVVANLIAYLPDYAKADPHIFEKVAPGFDQALLFVPRLKQALAATGALCPDTDMPDLVGALRKMSR